MENTLEGIISSAGFPVYLHGFSAIDSYLGRNTGAAVHILCGADIADLARLFEDIRYPGAAFANAAVNFGAKTVYFRCEDGSAYVSADAAVISANIRQSYHPSLKFLEFYQDCKTRRFYDPNDLYPLLRGIRDGRCGCAEPEQCQQWINPSSGHTPAQHTITDAAMILARYFPETTGHSINEIAVMSGNLCPSIAMPGPEEQRLLLTGLLEASNPAPGFELLKKTGYIGVCWPELAVLDDVDHSKEFHPEGNVWRHTMETLRYRKYGRGSPGAGFDLRLSLGLLLHDTGKPLSESAGSRRFDGHAELGELQARRFLERLDFDTSLVNDVCYLVRNHMLPAALPRLPLSRTGKIMASPLFPTLMELYRCDESSSFKGLDGYYQSSAAYQSYLKHRRNPAKTWYASR